MGRQHMLLQEILQGYLEGFGQLWGMWADMCLWICLLRWKVC
ncbi:hypothetical protein NC652_022331 [Populus alba x Populus x berolinensis]|nr:hypothetical protein NC652_022331 [Populus alba x Populus x berolinensis]